MSKKTDAPKNKPTSKRKPGPPKGVRYGGRVKGTPNKKAADRADEFTLLLKKKKCVPPDILADFAMGAPLEGKPNRFIVWLMAQLAPKVRARAEGKRVPTEYEWGRLLDMAEQHVEHAIPTTDQMLRAVIELVQYQYPKKQAVAHTMGGDQETKSGVLLIGGSISMKDWSKVAQDHAKQMEKMVNESKRSNGD